MDVKVTQTLVYEEKYRDGLGMPASQLERRS